MNARHARWSQCVAWFAAGGALAALADLALVANGTGAVGFAPLAWMVLALHGALALLAASAVYGAGVARRPAPTAALGLVAAPAVTLVGYLNLVHLPSIREPVTIAANTAALAMVAALVWALARSPRFATLASTTLLGWALALAGVAGGCWVARPASDTSATTLVEPGSGDHPNVFVVLLDSLRLDRTGAAAAGASRTPNLDALAARGTALTSAYAQASWTKPSVAAVFTSLFPTSHGANLRHDRLSEQPTTLPELFRDAGYRTAVFSANPWISPAFGFERGVHDFVESEQETFVRLVVLLRLLKLPDRAIPGRPISAGLARVEDFFGLGSAHRSNCQRDVRLAEGFEDWLDEHAGTRPLFAFFHLMSAHIPYDPPGNPGTFPNEEQVALLHSEEALAPERRRELIELYDATVGHADEVLGRIVAAIRSNGLEATSIIVASADHGEEFHDHGRWGHGKSLYDEVVRVPLVIAGPDVAHGARIATPAMLVDVMPTIAGLAGIVPPPATAGTRIDADPGRHAYAELLREGGVEHYMLVEDDAKYIESRARLGEPVRTELYDRRSDAAERDNLAEGAGDLDEWARKLDAIRSGARGHRVEGSTRELDDEETERLRALGYVN